MDPGEIGIADIELNFVSREDIPPLLPGLRHLNGYEPFRPHLFALLGAHRLPGAIRKAGLPGMEMWRVLVMSGAMQGLGCEIDRLPRVGKEHMT